MLRHGFGLRATIFLNPADHAPREAKYILGNPIIILRMYFAEMTRNQLVIQTDGLAKE